jgi:glycine/D-amino acid oxidase-like deaminating enzyme
MMKIAIVGAGIAGLSLAWALHKRGVTVELFDQGPIPNPVSSSFDEHRITRHTYGGLSGYGALMPDAFRIYDELWADFGVSHFHRTNLVYIGRQATGWYDATAHELDAAGIGHRRLSAGDIAARLPMMQPDGIVEAFESEGAGELFASRIVTDLARWLKAAGVALHPHTKVRDVEFDTGRFDANGPRSADLVVIAAGAWLPSIYPAAAGRLVPSRQIMLYLEPPADLAAAWAAAPIIVDTGTTHGGYILPPKDGTHLKIGDHVFSRKGHGDDDRIATSDDTAPVLTAAGEVFVGFDRYRVLEAKVCYYTVSADERFVVEPVGEASWLLSACSGHGFKLGPLIASGLADALVGRRPAAGIPDWAAGR